MKEDDTQTISQCCCLTDKIHLRCCEKITTPHHTHHEDHHCFPFIAAVMFLFLCLSSNVAADCNIDGLEPHTFDRILVLNFLRTGASPRPCGSSSSERWPATSDLSCDTSLVQIAGDYFGHKSDKDMPHLTRRSARKGVTWLLEADLRGYFLLTSQRILPLTRYKHKLNIKTQS